MPRTLRLLLVCLLIPLLVFVAMSYYKIKKQNEFRRKLLLAAQVRKVIEILPMDLITAGPDIVPADGQWHSHIGFKGAPQRWEYVLKEEKLFKISKGTPVLIAKDIDDVRIRREKQTPGIMEILIKAYNKSTLTVDLRIRVGH